MNAKQRRKRRRAWQRAFFGFRLTAGPSMLAASLDVPPVSLDEQLRRGWNKCIRDEGWPETMLVDEP
jgi:hypothetical protein